MKRFTLSLMFAFSILCGLDAAELNISGAWGWSSSNGDAVFMLNLEQKGSEITGQHSCMSNRDSKVDAAEETSITGQKKGMGFDVTFKSSLAGEGKAHIDIVDQHTISWTVTQKPSGKDFILPMKAILKDTAE